MNVSELKRLKELEAENKPLKAMYGEWAINTDIFDHFLEYHLCSVLKPEYVVVLDNIAFHHNVNIKNKIEDTGASIMYSPPYSPDNSPIENMWSKIKNYFRKLAARTDEEFHAAVATTFKSMQSSDLTGWFRPCGYIVDQ